MQPKSKEAAAKLKASEKMQKEAAFAAAIMTDADVPLAEEINPDEIGEQSPPTASRRGRYGTEPGLCVFVISLGKPSVYSETNHRSRRVR